MTGDRARHSIPSCPTTADGGLVVVTGTGARATLPGEILAFGIGVVESPEAEPMVRARVDGVIGVLADRHVRAYPNFVEEPAYVSAFFDPETWGRLRQVKTLYDPRDVLKANHPVPPA